MCLYTGRNDDLPRRTVSLAQNPGVYHDIAEIYHDICRSFVRLLFMSGPQISPYSAPGQVPKPSRPASTAAAVPDVVPDVVPPAPVAGELRRHRREERGTLEAEHGRWFRCESSPLKMECEPSR